MKYSDLRVWQKSMDLVELIYRVTVMFPSAEKFGLTNQIRKAVVSIPSNIAEGHGRKFTRAYMNNLSIAFGSLMELETQLRIACRLGYLQESSLNELLTQCDAIGKMLSGLIASLRKTECEVK